MSKLCYFFFLLFFSWSVSPAFGQGYPSLSEAPDKWHHFTIWKNYLDIPVYEDTYIYLDNQQILFKRSGQTRPYDVLDKGQLPNGECFWKIEKDEFNQAVFWTTNGKGDKAIMVGALTKTNGVYTVLYYSTLLYYN